MKVELTKQHAGHVLPEKCPGLADGGNVDKHAPPGERKRVLVELISTVVDDLDASGANPENKKSFLLHVAWHEGARLTTRIQSGEGPARSFYQMERGKAVDAVSAGTSQDAILSAWTELQGASGSYFPEGNLIGNLLSSDDHDLFATYMARIALKRVSVPIGTSYEEHADYWADHWKIEFPNNDRAQQVDTFISEAMEVDSLSTGKIVVYGPGGLRIEGMTVGDVASLLRRLAICGVR